jgi:hypothetical protein
MMAMPMMPPPMPPTRTPALTPDDGTTVGVEEAVDLVGEPVMVGGGSVRKELVGGSRLVKDEVVLGNVGVVLVRTTGVLVVLMVLSEVVVGRTGVTVISFPSSGGGKGRGIGRVVVMIGSLGLRGSSTGGRRSFCLANLLCAARCWFW